MEDNRQTLSEVVRLFLVEEDEYSEHKLARYMTLAIRIFKELEVDIVGGVRAKVIKADTNNPLRYNLPLDCVKVIRTGICDRGVIRAMAKESDLCLIENLDDCGNVRITDARSLADRNNDELFSEVYWNNEFSFGEHLGKRYGQRGGQSKAGVFRIDDSKGQIVVGSVLNGVDVILEYVSNGMDDPSSIYVHPLMEEALIAGIRWLSLRSKPREPMNSKIESRQEFYNQKRLLRARKTFPSKDELIQYARRGYQSAPKL